MSIQTLLSALLLAIYLVSSLGPDFVHNIIHDHLDAEHYSTNLELDACHRTVHHQDTINGCKHQAHFEVNVCDMEPIKEAVNPFLFIQNYSIPDGQQEYVAEFEMEVPEVVDAEITTS